MILVAGPYRSGTGDDQARLAANVRAMNETALALFRAGHLPVTGEALALPLIETAGGARPGADRMVAQARAQGADVYTSATDIPAAADPAEALSRITRPCLDR
jgi:hypothetical protein